MAIPALLTIILLQATTSAPASQQTSPTVKASAPVIASAAAAAASDSDPADPTVCRAVDVAGSAFPKRECHPVSVWNRRARSGGY